MKNNLIAILDQTFPGINDLFSSSSKKSNGHIKWVDFVLKYPHSEYISKKSFSAFSKSYASWCKKFGYCFSENKAKLIYDFACDCVPSIPFSESIGLIISQAVSDINHKKEIIASLVSEMNKIASTLPEYDTVKSMYGVGEILSVQLIAEIGDVSRFANKKALVGFAGLDPSPCQSGKYDPQSRPISKRGSGALRKALFQIVLSILQNAPIDNQVYLFLDKKRSEGKPFQVYMNAAANKFLRIYYARVMECIKALQAA